jgi:hypothetical protein
LISTKRSLAEITRKEEEKARTEEKRRELALARKQEIEKYNELIDSIVDSDDKEFSRKQSSSMPSGFNDKKRV